MDAENSIYLGKVKYFFCSPYTHLCRNPIPANSRCYIHIVFMLRSHVKIMLEFML